MLEALEKIREAEEENQQSLKMLQEELSDYSKRKDDELATLKAEHQQQLAGIIKEKIILEEQQMTEEKELLAIAEKQLHHRLLEQYETHQEEAINAIIERVIQTYGRH